MIIAVILAISLFAESNAADCEQPTNECNGTILTCCDSNFRMALGINSKCSGYEMFVDPECLRNEIEVLYASGDLNGIFSVCSEFYKFQTCLGNSFKECTSPRWQIKNGVSYQQAELYATVFAQFNFACGAGLDTYINEDKCMSSLFKSNSDRLKKCRNEFYNNIAANPAMKCIYLEQLTACYEKPFKDNCGVEAGWWGCEYERIGISLFYPECSPKCTVYQEIDALRNAK